MRTDISQGLCDTTQTERFVPVACKCPTYPSNLGPCATFEVQSNARCVYCDHLADCHQPVIEKLEKFQTTGTRVVDAASELLDQLISECPAAESELISEIVLLQTALTEYRQLLR